jgi:signal transduction histidine kinase
MIQRANPAIIAEQSEKKRQFIHNAIEMALSFGDFQKEIDSLCTPKTMLKEATKRIEHLVPFDISAFFLVDEDSSDFCPTICTPSDAEAAVEQEMAFLIQNGYLAWAIRERRGITVFSEDGSRQILLHVLATYSRVVGIFLGCFPRVLKRLPDASLEILSLILRNTANGLESLTCYGLIQQQNEALEQKVTEKTQRLLRFERQLMQAQKTEAIMALSGGIAHQFNNVLTGLLGNIDLLEMNCGDHADVAGFIRQARSVSDRMSHLTRQLLAYVQGGSHKPVLTPLNELINCAFPVLRRLVQPSVHLVTEQCPEKLKAKVDMTQMQMALSAIVTNAEEAISGSGEIRISAAEVVVKEAMQGDIDPLAAGSWICLTIQDTGKGMDQNSLKRLFEPFFTTKFEGRGLGMAMVSGIIKNHEGSIRVASQVGQGTQVSIYLPLVEDREA